MGMVAASSKAQVGRLGRDQLGPGRHVAAEGEWTDGQDLIADLDALDIRTDCRDSATALGAERYGTVRQTGIDAQRLQDVAEVEAGGEDLDFHLSAAGRPPAQGLQLQTVDGPGLHARQAIGFPLPPRPRAGIPALEWKVAMHVSLGATQGDLVLVVRRAQLIKQGLAGRARRQRIEVDQFAAQPGILADDDSAQADQGP